MEPSESPARSPSHRRRPVETHTPEPETPARRDTTSRNTETSCHAFSTTHPLRGCRCSTPPGEPTCTISCLRAACKRPVARGRRRRLGQTPPALSCHPAPQRCGAFFAANLARDWGFSWFPCGPATAATLQTLHLPAGKCLTALPAPCRDRGGRLTTHGPRFISGIGSPTPTHRPPACPQPRSTTAHPTTVRVRSASRSGGSERTAPQMPASAT